MGNYETVLCLPNPSWIGLAALSLLDLSSGSAVEAPKKPTVDNWQSCRREVPRFRFGERVPFHFPQSGRSRGISAIERRAGRVSQDEISLEQSLTGRDLMTHDEAENCRVRPWKLSGAPVNVATGGGKRVINIYVFGVVL